MHPVQCFKANFDPPAQESLATDSRIAISANGVDIYDAHSHVRNVCFIWEDGRKAFFNYAYLVTGDLIVHNSIDALVLSFSSYTVTLKGYNLLPLFNALLEHSAKTISAVNPRYATQNDFQDSVVIEIEIQME